MISHPSYLCRDFTKVRMLQVQLCHQPNQLLSSVPYLQGTDSLHSSCIFLSSAFSVVLLMLISQESKGLSLLLCSHLSFSKLDRRKGGK